MSRDERSLSGGEEEEKRVGELGKTACGKRGLTCWRGGRGRNGLVSLEMWHVAKWGLTIWRGGRGRSGLVSLETWHVTKEDSKSGGEEEEEKVSENRNVACHK